jgi:hypothetical protein
VLLDLIQHTTAAVYLDYLSAALVATGYKRTTIQRYLRAAAHVSYWQHRRGRSLTELGSVCIEEFKRHLPGCRRLTTAHTQSGHPLERYPRRTGLR